MLLEGRLEGARRLHRPPELSAEQGRDPPLERQPLARGPAERQLLAQPPYAGVRTSRPEVCLRHPAAEVRVVGMVRGGALEPGKGPFGRQGLPRQVRQPPIPGARHRGIHRAGLGQEGQGVPGAALGEPELRQAVPGGLEVGGELEGRPEIRGGLVGGSGPRAEEAALGQELRALPRVAHHPEGEVEERRPVLFRTAPAGEIQGPPQRRQVPGIHLEGPPELLEGLPGSRQRSGQELGELRPERHLGGSHRRREGRLEHSGEALDVPPEPVEVAQSGLRSSVAGLLDERAAVGLEGRALVAAPPEFVGQPDPPERPFLRRLPVDRRLPAEAQERAHAARAPVEVGQGLRHHRHGTDLRAGRLEVGDGTRGIAELAPEDPGQAQPEGQALGSVRGRGSPVLAEEPGEARLEEGGAPGRGLGRARELQPRRGGHRMSGLELEDPCAVLPHGLRGDPGLTPAQEDPDPELDLPRRRGRRGGFELLGEGAGDVGGAPAALLERGEPTAQVRPIRAEPDRLPKVRRRGVRPLPVPFLQSGQPLVQRRRLPGRRLLEPLAESFTELVDRAASLEQDFEALPGLGRHLILAGGERPVRRLGLLEAAELPFEECCAVEEQDPPLGSFGLREGEVEAFEPVLGIGAPAQGAVEPGAGLRGSGAALENGPPRPGGLGEATEAGQELSPPPIELGNRRVVVGEPRPAVGQPVDELGESTGPEQQRLDPLLEFGVGQGSAPEPRQGAGGPAGVGDLALLELGGAEQAGGPGGTAARLGLPQEPAGGVFGPALLLEEGGQQAGGAGVPGSEVRGRAEGRLRLRQLTGAPQELAEAEEVGQPLAGRERGVEASPCSDRVAHPAGLFEQTRRPLEGRDVLREAVGELGGQLQGLGSPARGGEPVEELGGEGAQATAVVGELRLAEQRVDERVRAQRSLRLRIPGPPSAGPPGRPPARGPPGGPSARSRARLRERLPGRGRLSSLRNRAPRTPSPRGRPPADPARGSPWPWLPSVERIPSRGGVPVPHRRWRSTSVRSPRPSAAGAGGSSPSRWCSSP